MMSLDEMSHELQLTKANRLQLARAFRHNPRVDYSIDCVIEGQMGRAYTDDLSNPTAYRITIGPFWYFAGDANSPGGRALLSEWPPYNLLMPSPPEWAAAAKAMFGERLVAFPRYSFAAGDLSAQAAPVHGLAGHGVGAALRHDARALALRRVFAVVARRAFLRDEDRVEGVVEAGAPVHPAAPSVMASTASMRSPIQRAALMAHEFPSAL